MKLIYLTLPIISALPQLYMTLNSFNQMRFEEFYEAVAAPFWFSQGQIINGLHVNVGWYAFLVAIYNLFGFSLHTGKITYLVMAIFSNFALFYLLRKFFKVGVAAVILFTIVLSPTYLYMNAVNLHWALTFHILIAILLLLYLLDFKKRTLSLIVSAVVFFLMMWGWLSYQAFVFYIPSLVIFYFLKLSSLRMQGSNYPSSRSEMDSRLRGNDKKGKIWSYIAVSAMVFLLPLVALFAWVDNRHILIADTEVGGGLFRGGGSFNISEQVFVQGWVDFISDFFIKGVSHHYEVGSAEFSLIFPIITLVFIAYWLIKIATSSSSARPRNDGWRILIWLALLVIGFDIVVFSTTSDLGLPGMKRLTPMLVSIYFLWVLVWWAAEKRVIRRMGGRWVIRGVLGLLLLHHLVVYPVNLSAIKEPSPFKVADWFDSENPQRSVDVLVEEAQKKDLLLDCRPIIEKFGGCSYDFIYPAVAGSCQWNRLSCHKIMGYDPEDGKFKELSIEIY